MKIRLEIIQDDGTSKETEIIGDPAPESILKLIRQLLNIPTESTSTAVSSSQPGASTIQSQQPHTAASSQTLQTQSPQSTPPSTQPIPTSFRGTRDFNIAPEEYSRLKNESLTIKERLELFLNFEYQDHWFTSLEVKKDYDRVYGSINLSTVSTYLSRLYREGKLERMGNRNQRKYRIRKEVEQQEYLPEAFWYQRMRA